VIRNISFKFLIVFFIAMAHVGFSHEKYKNIIFDLGGVLLRWDPEHILRKTFAEDEVPLEFLDILSTSLWYDYDGGHLSRDEVVLNLPDGYDREKFAVFERQISKYVYPVPEMIDILNDVKKEGYRVYILSNMPKEIFSELNEFYNLSAQFHGQVVSSHVKCIKPYPSIYQELLSAFSLHAEECLFIDDRPENIRGGEEIGIDGVLFHSPKRLRKTLEELQVLSQ
jgi:putative hydrolase of the HAD superfamily